MKQRDSEPLWLIGIHMTIRFIIRWSIFLTILFFHQRLSSDELQQFKLIRQDGTSINGYLSPPLRKKTFPIAILCQGSYCKDCTTQSVYPFHIILAKIFNSVGIGVLSIEKRGVDKDHFDADIFHEYNVIENRMDDYKEILYSLSNHKLDGWNSQLIFIGTSEGGWIAPRLAHIVPETCAVMIFGGAGAWKFKDEIVFLLKKNGSPLTEQEIESQFKTMIDNPSPKKFWLNQTYKFWAQGLELSNRDDILNLSCPTYLSIGSKDDCIESSDELWVNIQESNKTNVTYARYEGLDHDMMDDRYTVFQDAVKWIENVIRPN